MPTPEDFNFTYGKNTPQKVRFNRAIRKEVPGGDGTLHLLELIHQIRTNRGGHPPDPAALLATIQDRVHGIRDQMVDAIKRKYQLNQPPP